MKRNNVLFRLFVGFVLAFCATASTFAQNGLAGREYYNANILADKMDKIVNMPPKELQEAKEKYVAEQEEKKGRKFNAKERAAAEKDFDEQMAGAVNMLKGMKTAVTMEFTTATQGVTKVKITLDEAALKMAGVPWIQRKAMKAAIATVPESEKFDYTLQGDMVILKDKQESDTMRISSDGKTLTGKMDGDKVVLKRTK